MTKSVRAKIGDFLLRHPAVDVVPPLAAGAWWFVSEPILVSATMRVGFYQGVAAVAGLALAAATFACSMTYQSSNILFSKVRQKHASDLRRNWQSIILWMLAGALVALSCMVLDSAWVRTAMAVAIAATTIVALKSIRAVFWLGYTLFMDEVEDSRPQRIPAPPLPASRI